MMNGFKRYVGLSAVLVPVVAGLVSGCGSDASSDPPQEEVKVQVDAPGSGAANGSGSSSTATNPTTGSGSVDAPGVEDFGLYRGTWDGKELKFEPIEEATGGIKTKGFVELDFNKFTITTEQSIAVNNGGAQCTTNASQHPTTNFADGADHPFNGGFCTNKHLCALIKIANPSTTKKVQRLYAELVSVTPSGFTGSNSDPVPSGGDYPVSSSVGLWQYGTLNANTTGTPQAITKEWDFNLPSCADFQFVFRLKGTLVHTGYDASEGELDAGEFVDACSLPGKTTILTSTTAARVTGISTPFEFSLYDQTFDTTFNHTLGISANGALGLGPVVPATGVNQDLPTTGNFPRMVFPFWSNITTSASGVCYASTGATPNRKFVVTWKDAILTGDPDPDGGTLTFSAVINEGSDDIFFQYAPTLTGIYSDYQRGLHATIGIQQSKVGSTPQSTTKISFNDTYLPFFAQNGYFIKLTATPSSTF